MILDLLLAVATMPAWLLLLVMSLVWGVFAVIASLMDTPAQHRKPRSLGTIPSELRRIEREIDRLRIPALAPVLNFAGRRYRKLVASSGKVYHLARLDRLGVHADHVLCPRATLTRAMEWSERFRIRHVCGRCRAQLKVELWGGRDRDTRVRA